MLSLEEHDLFFAALASEIFLTVMCYPQGDKPSHESYECHVMLKNTKKVCLKFPYITNKDV